MSDIVERLRHCSENYVDEYLHELTGKAADTITRLTAEVEREKAYGTTMHAEWEKQREENVRVKAENERLWEAKRGTDNVTSRLTAENEKLGRDYQSARDAHDKVLAENEKLRAALEAALENGVGVSYSCDEDECGNHVCCGEVSYKPHAPDCWTLKARAALSGDKQ